MTKTDSITVLIIDDNPVDRMTYRRYLENTSSKYIVHEAEDGTKGIESADFLQPDCVLLDLRLADQSGFEVLIALVGENAATPHIPVIMMSGTTAPSLVDGALSFGAYSYLLKGRFGQDILDETIQAAIAKCRTLS